MEEANEEILNFNEILFQPSQEIIRAPANPPRTPPKSSKQQTNRSSNKSPRKISKQKKQSTANTDILSSTTGSTQIKREMLSPHLQNSPLLSGPFQIRSPDLGISRSPRSARGVSHATKTTKARNIVNQTTKGNFVPPIVNPYSTPTSARQRGRSTSDSRSLLYSQRNRLLSINRQDFFNDLSHKYQNRANMTPYGMDMTIYREMALKRSEQNRKEEQYEDMIETSTTNRIKTQARKAEVENDKRFTRDYIINSHYPELRMIPVSDRIDRAGDDTVVFI